MVAAYNLNVDCLSSSVQVGAQVSCNIFLDQNVSQTFGDQFVINAPGFTAAQNFIQGQNNIDATSNGLGQTTVLIENNYNTNRGQARGVVTTFNLVAQTEGARTISLSNLVIAQGSQSDTITIVQQASQNVSSNSSTNTSSQNNQTNTTTQQNQTTTTPLQQEVAPSAGSSGGGGGGGGGGGSSKSSSTTNSKPQTTPPTSTSPKQQEQVIGSSANTQNANQDTQTAAQQTSSSEQVREEIPGDKFPWFIIISTSVILVGAIVAGIIRHVKKSNQS